MGRDRQTASVELRRKADILFLKHAGSILRHSSNPVYGSWKSQASFPWAKQHRACSIMEKPHTALDDCLRILLSYFRARNSALAVPLYSVNVNGWGGLT